MCVPLPVMVVLVQPSGKCQLVRSRHRPCLILIPLCHSPLCHSHPSSDTVKIWYYSMQQYVLLSSTWWFSDEQWLNTFRVSRRTCHRDRKINLCTTYRIGVMMVYTVLSLYLSTVTTCGRGLGICGRGLGMCGRGLGMCGRGLGTCGRGLSMRVVLYQWAGWGEIGLQ